MALEKEIWLSAIIAGLFADNSFAARSINHSEFVNGKTVHVPNAGSGPSVQKNRSSLPGSIASVADNDLTYSIAEFTTDPVLVKNAEKVELSYSKREAVISSSRANMFEAVYQDLIYGWVPASPTTQATLGIGETAHITSATGTRNKMNKKTVLAIKAKFDADNIPSTGRYILLDSVMYNQLLDDMTDSETNRFLAGADPANGTIGFYMSFNFYMRSQVAKTTNAGVLKAWTASASATDSAAGLAWHEQSVSRAIGETEFFDNDKRAEYYGDIMSFLVRAGGSAIRYDKKGIILIYQATTVALHVATVIETNETVAAADDGSITITAAGGVAPYLYSINNGSSWSQSNAFTGLTHTTYNVKVLDSAGTVAAYASNPVTIAAGA